MKTAKTLTLTALSSRKVQLALLVVAAVAAAAVWLTRPSEPAFAMGDLGFGSLALAMEADMANERGCAGTETEISTPHATGYQLPDFSEGDELPAELVELFEREVHAVEHVDEWRIDGARVLILAHDLDDDVRGPRLFSTLTELMLLTGGAAGDGQWVITQLAFITECW